jgi:hypothetical protein
MDEIKELKQKLENSLKELSKVKTKDKRNQVSDLILDGIGLLVIESKDKDKISPEQENFFKDLIDANLILPKSNRIEWGYGFDNDWSFISKLSKPIIEYFPKNITENKKISKIFSFKEGMSLNPNDVELNKVMSPFLGDDALRPAMMGINFDENGATATNAHILLHIGGKSTKEGVFYPIDNLKVKDREVGAKYPNYIPIIQSDYELITTIDTQLLFDAVNTFLKSSLLNPQTNQLFIKVDGLKDYLDKDFYAGFNAEYLKDTLSSWLMMGVESLSVYNQDKNINRQFLFVPNGITIYEKYAIQKQLLEGVFSIIMPVISNYDYQEKAFIHIQDKNNFTLTYLNSKPFVIKTGKSSVDSVKVKRNTQSIINDLMELIEFETPLEKKKTMNIIEDLRELMEFE